MPGESHLDHNVHIRREEFGVIPTKIKFYSEEVIKMFDVLSRTS